MKTITLAQVPHLPRELEPEILYVSEEFGIAGHLCACGCGKKIITPLGPTDWKLTVKNGMPTLYPSIGSWQIPCKSHYWIADGVIKWSIPWSEEQILAGRHYEALQRESYYEGLQKAAKPSLFRRIFKWLFSRNKKS